MPPTQKQIYSRKCFILCTRAWKNLPAACPPPPSCGNTTSKASVWAWKNDRGVMSGYYDMFMRCCMDLCGPTGNIEGDINTCFPCDSDFPPFGPDPDNPQTIAGGDTVEVAVLGGVGPYIWVLLEGDCLSPADGVGLSISVSADPGGCCSGEYLVTDACGNTCLVGLRGIGGSWVLQNYTTCMISGPQTSNDWILQGLWNINEVLVTTSVHSIGTLDADVCGGYVAYRLEACRGECETVAACDDVIGCDTNSACIDEHRGDPCRITNNCTGGHPTYYGAVTGYCIDKREVWKWVCP